MPETLKLSSTAVSIYVVLMAERQILASSEIAALLRVKQLDSTALGQLRKLDLLSVSKKGRENGYELSEEGWRRCFDILTAPTTARGAASNALFVVLNGLQRGLVGRAIGPKNFFVPSDDGNKGHTSETVHTSDAQQQVRETYTKLSRHPGDWVPLADLREALGQYEQAEIDAALESLAKNPHVYLIPWDNRKALRQRDHDAAFHFGGDDNHALRIEEI